MNLFPLFIDLERKRVLIVGGGEVAREKYEKLAPFTSNLVVVAKESNLQCAHLHLKAFEESDLDGIDLVICATDDRALNRQVADLCKGRGIPVNIVDNPELCTFIFPSLIKTENVSIGITSSGKSPLVSKYLRQEFERQMPDNIDEVIDELYDLKLQLKQTEPDQKKRAAILKERFRELMV